MTQYIDKDALVAEIKERIETYNKGYANGDDRRADAMEVLLHDIDTLEVKEVDLDTDFGVYWGEYCDCGGNINDYKVAEHFFELGLKVSQKGEDVDAQIKSQNEAIKNLNSALNSMEHNGHLPKMMTAAESLGISEEEYAKIEDEFFKEQEEPVSEDLGKELPKVWNRETLDEYAYQVAYDLSNDWMRETPTWDDVETACKLGAMWKEKQMMKGE